MNQLAMGPSVHPMVNQEQSAIFNSLTNEALFDMLTLKTDPSLPVVFAHSAGVNFIRYQWTHRGAARGHVVPIVVPPFDVTDKLIREKRFSKGTTGDTGADPKEGGIKQRKDHTSVLPRQMALDALHTFEHFWDRKQADGGCSTFRSMISLLNDVFNTRILDITPILWCKTFVKLELQDMIDIVRGKSAREIWNAPSFPILLDMILFSPLHAEWFVNLVTGDMHGINHTGSGWEFFFNLLIRDLEDDTGPFAGFLKGVAAIIAEEDDVTKWDFSQYLIDDILFYHASAEALGLCTPSKQNFIKLGLLVISNFYSSTQFISGKGCKLMLAVYRMLASGCFNTAIKGSHNHSRITSVVDIEYRLLTRKLKEIYVGTQWEDVVLASIKALEKKKNATFSDDMATAASWPAAWVMCLVDKTYHYSNNGLVLKPSRVNVSGLDNAYIESVYQLTVKHLPPIHEVMAQLKSRFPVFFEDRQLDYGTPDGKLWTQNIPAEAKRYDAATRLRHGYFSLLTVLDEKNGFRFKGCTFLQNTFAYADNHIIPYRYRHRWLQRLFKSKGNLAYSRVGLSTLIIVYAFFTAGDPLYYMKLREMYYVFTKNVPAPPMDDLLAVVNSDYKLAGLDLTADDLTEFPSYQKVMDLYIKPVGALIQSSDHLWVSQREAQRYTGPTLHDQKHGRSVADNLSSFVFNDFFEKRVDGKAIDFSKMAERLRKARNLKIKQ
jgi:hypothetical protein